MVGVILILLFGLIGLFQMPYQLSPDVREPEISVETVWVGATPYEIESDIIEEQEKVLKGIPNLIEMESTSSNSFGSITLRFKIGTDIDDALLRVSNKLNEVPSYPQNVEKPVIKATGASADPIIWMVLKTKQGNERSVDEYRTYFENEIRQYLERVDGVASLFIGGGTEREMHVIVYPEKLAAYNMTLSEFVNALSMANSNVSAGNLDVGRRSYRIRTVGEFESPEEIETAVIKSDGSTRVRVSDVAEVRYGYEKKDAFILHNNEQGIAMGIEPESGVNVLDLTNRVEEVVQWLNEEKLAPENIYIKWVYDQRSYIKGAIDLVRQNILIGGALAIIVLLVYLRSISATVVVGAAIPISIIGTFFFMSAFGRNLNVVSLAGIAFAVGMLVDNAIVVLENIYRHRVSLDESPFSAAYYGTKEIGGAIFASTMTTVAVFLPVVFMEEEAGQLFRDIAIAVSCAVLLSFVVSITVIPMFSKSLFGLQERITSQNGEEDKKKKKGFHPFIALRNFIGHIGNAILSVYMFFANIFLYSWVTRLLTVIVFTAAALFTAWRLIPNMEYLPTGNRNFIVNVLIPPPGLSYKERKEIGEYLFDQTAPYFYKEGQPLPGIETKPGETTPGIEDMFYVGAERFMFCGAMSTMEQKAGLLLPLFTRTINSIAGMRGVSIQAGIFQNRIGGSRSVDIDLSGADINQLVQVGGAMFGTLMQQIPNVQIRPVPSLEILYPEVQIIPNRDRLRAAGLSARELGVGIDIIMDGRKIGEFKREGQKKIDMVAKSPEYRGNTPENLANILISTPGGEIVPVFSLAEFEDTAGITEIRHLERNRTITLQVTPPQEITIEEAMNTIEKDAIPQLKQMGLMEGVSVNLSGSADKLTQTRKALQWNLLLAAVITYLLMSALLGNFIYPLVIMFTVPLAAAGGFIGLKLVNIYSMATVGRPVPFDVLTMLGFIILIGVVVNNAILIVAQTLNNIRTYRMKKKEAVKHAIETRIRPIYMSATTSIFGMSPLVIAPGPGSELYRGLGSVVLGGLAVSTVFTIFVIPSLLMFFLGMENKYLKKKKEEEGE